jgi:hypothetical protein
MSISITRNAPVAVQSDTAAAFNAAADAAKESAGAAAQLAAKPGGLTPVWALKLVFDNVYTEFQKVWQESLLYAAAEFLHEKFDGHIVQIDDNGTQKSLNTTVDFYDYLRGSANFGIIVYPIADIDSEQWSKSEVLSWYTSKSPGEAAPYMTVAMAYFNRPGSSVRKARLDLSELAFAVSRPFVSNSSVYELFRQYPAVYDHWRLMIRCLTNDDASYLSMFELVKTKRRRGKPK